MNNVRWESPFPYTLAFNLFKQHFQEINRSYWAFVPAANTIKSLAKKNFKDDGDDPKTFFLIPDEEDKRIALTYGEWKIDFSEYINHSRLNIIMMLSSCFETYLRTVVSLAFESKPGVIISCINAVDGAQLLKQDITYGEINNKSYRFLEEIDDVCRGEWSKRLSAFQNYFGTLPADLLALSGDLDELRITRNSIGHYLGRRKSDYEAPIDFKPHETIRVSHNRILKYFNLVYSAAKKIDEYLQKNVIGSYDIIKSYFIAISNGEIVPNDKSSTESEQLRKIIGKNDLKTVGKTYYNALTSFCSTNYIDSETDCIFTRRTCIFEINRRLQDKGIIIKKADVEMRCDLDIFKSILNNDNLYSNPKYSKRSANNMHEIQYLHSAALIDYVSKKLESNANDITNIL